MSVFEVSKTEVDVATCHETHINHLALTKRVARAQVNMSVAVIPMAQELGWSATERGLVSSSFFWGYSLTQIPAGWLATK